MTIKILLDETGTTGKLAEAELHFGEADGVLAGLKLMGFGVWARKTGGGRNVTMPARKYSVNNETRSFSLLRPIDDDAARAGIADAILAAYDAHVAIAASNAADFAADAAGWRAEGGTAPLFGGKR